MGRVGMRLLCKYFPDAISDQFVHNFNYQGDYYE